ncbi:Bug family tripartite tricarboxylate transporter substrate binding protein [Comamonas odontotermitis]|uniref:Bug family tripartite tricarboxylate transporter substrate binding protein n=1 Tax=Comamonas odontotermitis TaxID=379895 RepID=UPI001CC657E1|nr:tripartite tricarboxylate transporter substrate binding protein [Comamonas odontotermitis]UBB16842.1 tripartite tricarboxylate transporter substrate binding protein [Comamonas odontotermitis]
MSLRFSLRHAVAVAAVALPAVSFAAYPDHPIEWVVPYAAGGGSDVVARVVAEPMAKALGQSIIIINKPGAATNIGADYAARAKPDGYTVLTGDTGTLAANPYLYKKLSYSAEKDFSSVGLLVRFPMILVVNPKLPVKNLQEFEAWAKAQSGGVSYATPGAGSPHHLATEIFRERAHLNLVHVPYKGAAPAVQDVMGGQVPFMFVDSVTGYQNIQAGKLRAIGIATPKRSKVFPDIPTLDEQGVKGYEAYAWQGVVVPKATPADRTELLSKQLQATLKEPAVTKRLEEMGLEVTPSNSVDMDKFLAAERAKLGPVIKSNNIQLD